MPNSVFFHIPKTGGVWVRQAVSKSGVKYIQYQPAVTNAPLGLEKWHIGPDIFKQHGKDTSLFSFTFVRHPLTWYQSYFAYRMKNGWRTDFILDNTYQSDDFNDLVSVHLDEFPDGFVSRMYKMFLGENIDKIDYIGRQENLSNDVITAMDMAGETYDKEVFKTFPEQNTAAQDDDFKSQVVYDPAVKKRVLEVEKWTIDNFYNEKS